MRQILMRRKAVYDRPKNGELWINPASGQPPGTGGFLGHRAVECQSKGLPTIRAGTTGLSPKKTSACRFGGRKARRPVPIPRFFGGTSIASLMEECGG